MANQSPNIRGPSRPKDRVTAAIGDVVVDGWRRAIDWLAGERMPPVQLTGLNAFYLRARREASAGNLAVAERRFADLVATAPDFSPALEAHGETLEMLGESERAA